MALEVASRALTLGHFYVTGACQSQRHRHGPRRPPAGGPVTAVSARPCGVSGAPSWPGILRHRASRYSTHFFQKTSVLTLSWKNQEADSFGEAGSPNNPELMPGETVQPYHFGCMFQEYVPHRDAGVRKMTDGHTDCALGLTQGRRPGKGQSFSNLPPSHLFARFKLLHLVAFSLEMQTSALRV